jgi:hypothetical protein
VPSIGGSCTLSPSKLPDSGLHIHEIQPAQSARVEGPLVFVRWHVVDGSRMDPDASSHADHVRTAVTGRLDDVDAQLVGFFARSAQGVYTHVSQRTTST